MMKMNKKEIIKDIETLKISISEDIKYLEEEAR